MPVGIYITAWFGLLAVSCEPAAPVGDIPYCRIGFVDILSFFHESACLLIRGPSQVPGFSPFRWIDHAFKMQRPNKQNGLKPALRPTTTSSEHRLTRIDDPSNFPPPCGTSVPRGRRRRNVVLLCDFLAEVSVVTLGTLRIIFVSRPPVSRSGPGFLRGQHLAHRHVADDGQPQGKSIAMGPGRLELLLRLRSRLHTGELSRHLDREGTRPWVA